MGKRVIVTGADGFIGSNLVKSSGNFWMPYDKELWDITSRLHHLSSLNGIEHDVCVHLAAETNPRNMDYRSHFMTNVLGTSNVLDSVRPHCKHFIFVSTASGNTEPSPYSETKREAERLVRESGIPYTIVRLTNVSGAGSGLINLLFDVAESTQTFYLNGDDYDTKDGTPVRDYCFIDDVVAFIEELIMAGGKNKTYILGSGYMSSVLDVVYAVRAYASYDINVVVNPKAAGDESEVDYMDGPEFVHTDVYGGEEQTLHTVVERVYGARMSRRSRVF